MSAAFLTIAMAIVRGWTRLYTCRMDPALRDERRAEIESDLWESQEDVRWAQREPAAVAGDMLVRLLRGASDDLFWRVEHARVHIHVMQQALWATAVASVVCVVWLMSALETKVAPLPQFNVVRLLYPVRLKPPQSPGAWTTPEWRATPFAPSPPPPPPSR